MYACTFKVLHYGTSGNELPPPILGTTVRTILSGQGEDESHFRARMQTEGLAIRELLEKQFGNRPYSQVDGCDWEITLCGSLSVLVHELTY